MRLLWLNQQLKPYDLQVNGFIFWAKHDDVIKWRHFPRYWPFFAANSPVPGEFPTQRPLTKSFDVFFDLRLNKRLCKQSWGWWLETPLRPLWRLRNNSLTFISYHIPGVATIFAEACNITHSIRETFRCQRWGILILEPRVPREGHSTDICTGWTPVAKLQSDTRSKWHLCIILLGTNSIPFCLLLFP